MTVSESLDRVHGRGRRRLDLSRRRGARRFSCAAAPAGCASSRRRRCCVEDGVIANAGAGMKYWWRERPRGALRRLGLRVEGRASMQVVGASRLGDDRRRVIAPVFPAVSSSDSEPPRSCH